jgi:hypothetical protein
MLAPPGAFGLTTRTLVSSCSGTPSAAAELGIITAFAVVFLTLVVRAFAKLG